MSIKAQLMEELPWFTMHVWLYHVIKLLTGCAVTAALMNAGLPLLIAAVAGMGGTILIPHLIGQWTGAFRFNVRDTVFDIIASSGSLWTFLIKPFGWYVGLSALPVTLALYAGLLLWHWNSP